MKNINEFLLNKHKQDLSNETEGKYPATLFGTPNSSGIYLCKLRPKSAMYPQYIIDMLKELNIDKRTNTCYAMYQMENRFWTGDLRGQDGKYFNLIQSLCDIKKYCKYKQYSLLSKQDRISIIVEVAHMAWFHIMDHIK